MIIFRTYHKTNLYANSNQDEYLKETNLDFLKLSTIIKDPVPMSFSFGYGLFKTTKRPGITNYP